jgi:hypothetical protein
VRLYLHVEFSFVITDIRVEVVLTASCPDGLAPEITGGVVSLLNTVTVRLADCPAFPAASYAMAARE